MLQRPNEDVETIINQDRIPRSHISVCFVMI